jgi:uncharacterized iron-regulated protein
MPLLSTIGFVLAQQGGATMPDPHLLPIGRPGSLSIAPGQMVDTRTGKLATPADVAAAADGTQFVLLGENHDQLEHHQMQADIIRALVQRGRDVIVGFEMFTRPVQAQLNPWTLGWWSEEEFIQKADWKGQWGFDFAVYRPIFAATREYKLPMVALNVPRDWVRRVGRDGFKALTAEEQAQVPAIDTKNADHRSIFGALMGGHPPTGDRGENIYTAQVLWDTAMADSALKYLKARPANSKTVFVIVAGSGHIMYGQGINYRIRQQSPSATTLDVVMVTGSEQVSKGLGEFVYRSK